MAAESILVVDDNPMNVKLIRALLAGEGYEVRVAECGDEALAVLETFRPQLILMDIQLPGMDGLEATRRIRAHPALRDTRIVALTAYAMRGDEQKARAAGCDGYITKPIDTRTLPGIIREILARNDRVEPVRAGGDTQDLLSELRNSFLAEGMEETRHMLESLPYGFDVQKAQRFLHRWAGIAGTLGYSEITRKARESEQLLREPLAAIGEAFRQRLQEIASCFAAAASAHPVGRVWPPEMVACLSGRRLALIGFEASEADRITRAAEQAQVFCRLFDSHELTPDSAVLAPFDLLVVKLSDEPERDPWSDPHRLENSRKPLLLAGPCEILLRHTRDASDLLATPWDPEEVVIRAYRLLSKGPGPAPTAHPGKPLVLVADDDFTVTSLVTATLEKFNMDCRMAHDGAEALHLAQQLHPDALVLDVNMPQLDGFGVLLRLRMEPATSDIPVVLLTARQQETDVVRGFGYGAADYVVKPFSPVELAARVTRLITPNR